MNYINRLEFELEEEKEHILFLQKLLELLHGEEWNTLTASRAETLTTISKIELDKLKNQNKVPETFADITPAHICMVHDIIEILGAEPADSQKAKDILLKIKSKVSIRTVVVVPLTPKEGE